MKQILFVVNHLKGGGIEQVLLDLVSLLKNKYIIRILALYDCDSVYKEELSHLVKYDCLDKRRIIKFRPLLSLYSRLYDKDYIQRFLFRKYIQKNRFDTVIAFSDGFSVRLIAESNFWDSRKIAWVHTDFFDDENLKDWQLDQLQKLYENYDRVVLVSNLLKEKYEQRFGLKNGLCIYNSINKNRISNDFDRPKEVNNGKLNFIAVGRLSWEKGFDRLILSMARLSSSLRNKCHLTIVGEGPERNNLESLIEVNHVEDSVTLVGFVKNPFTVYQNADVLLMPSRFEGFGLVLLESLYMQIPIVSTDTAGATEILQNGKYGILLKNEDNAFDEILVKLISNPSMLMPYQNLSSEALERFDTNEIMKQVESIL